MQNYECRIIILGVIDKKVGLLAYFFSCGQKGWSIFKLILPTY